MRTAVLYSGQARTFRRCLPSQFWQVLRKLPDPHFFCSVADDADANDMELLRKNYEHVEVEKVTQPEIPEPQGATTFHQLATPYTISVPVQAVLKQLWSLNRVWEFFNEKHTGDYDLFVRIRPDLFFHHFEVPAEWPIQRCLAPWWGSYSGVNDRFAILSPGAAEAYFTGFVHLSEMLAEGCPLHPESLVAYAMERAGVRISRTLDAEFSTLRKPDDPRVPTRGLMEFPVYLPGDLYRFIAGR
jgi:hypothetical protein